MLILREKRDFEIRIRQLEREVLKEKDYSDELRNKLKEANTKIDELMKIIKED